MDHSLVTKGLHNLMTLWAMSCRATQDGRIVGKSSDKMWSAEGENGKSRKYSCCENPWTVWKDKKIWHWKMSPRSVSVQYANEEEQRANTNSSRKNEAAGPKWKWQSVIDISGDENKIQCCKEHYCIGTWNVRSVNQGKLGMVKQEMARVNINILGIGELRWTGMGEFNSDDHYIYNCGQESLWRNRVALEMQYLGTI